MGTQNINKMHKEHKKWKTDVEKWNQEIEKLLKSLEKAISETSDSDVKTKVKKYKNHLIHNNRFLKEMLEVIATHELFLEEYEELDFPESEPNMDHDKTKEHIKEFEKRFDRLKVKIQKLIDQ